MADNMNAINISIVGLSSSTMFDLRSKIRDLVPKKYVLHWVNVTDAHLDLMVIDQDFIEARSIQKILSYRRIAVLQVSRNAVDAGGLVDSVLYLPFTQDDQLRRWLHSHVLRQELSDYTEEIVQPAAEQAIDVHVFERLTSKTLGRVKLMDSHGVLGVADTSQELFWPAHRRANTLVIDHTLGVTYSTSNDLKDVQKQPVDLKQWLWQTVWNSPLYGSLAQPHDHLRLLFWPQPSANAERREVLRLTAYFQEQQLSVAQMAEHVQLPITRVQHFASALLAAGLAEMLPRDQHPVAQPPVDVEKNSSSVGWRSLFSKLRSQLGM
jgi:hypothetical protein